MTDLSKFLGEEISASPAPDKKIPDIAVSAVLPCRDVSQGVWPGRELLTFHGVQHQHRLAHFPGVLTLTLAVLSRVQPGSWSMQVGILAYGEEEPIVTALIT